jgi:hypothetical protein
MTMTIYQRAVLQLLIAIAKFLMHRSGTTEAILSSATGYAEGHLEAGSRRP